MMCDVQVVVVLLLLLLLLSTNTFATEPSRTATGSAFVPSPCLPVQMFSLYSMRAAQVPIDGRLHASCTRPSACTGHITGGDDDGGDDDDDDDDNDDDDDDGDDDDDDDEFICQTFCRLAIVLPVLAKPEPMNGKSTATLLVNKS